MTGREVIYKRYGNTTTILIVSFFIVCWCFFFFYYPYHLYYKEQIMLFVIHDGYLMSYFCKPAFLSKLIGDYLTQYYLLTGVGPTIITIILGLLWFGMQKAFQKLQIEHSALWALIPVIVEGILSCHIEYPLSMTIGLILAVWLFVGYSQINSRTISTIFSFISIALLYIFIGAHFLVYTILILRYEIENKKISILYTLALLFITILIPIIGSWFYHLTIPQSFFYPLLERYLINPYIYLFIELSIVFVIILTLFLKHFWIGISICSIFTATSILCFTDKKEETILAFSSEAYFGRWNKVSELFQKSTNHSYISSYYTNLSHAREDKLADNLLEYYQPASHGLLIEVSGSVNYIYILSSIDALMECGDMAQAQHSAMLGMAFSPYQRSSRAIRKLTEIAIINEDYDAAKKYLWMLQHTSLHKKWAKTKLELIENDLDLIEKRSLLAKEDILFTNNDWTSSFRNLLDANPTNKTAVDYLLCYHLLNKDLDNFKKDYDLYYYPLYGLKPAKLYQEALLPCFEKELDPLEQLSYYHISESLFEDCIDFLEIYWEKGTQPEVLKSRFGTTYWFYLYYAQIETP